MTVSAHDVVRTLRQQLPGVGVKKLHKLLYLCQGHHLAMLDRPMFNEEIRAYDRGPVVARLWQDENRGDSLYPVDLDEASLNTLGYVLSRYGALSGRDLEILSHGQDPWQAADRTRANGGDDIIGLDSMKAYFAEVEAEDDTPWPDDDAIRAWLEGAAARREGSSQPDDIERLRARARGR